MIVIQMVVGAVGVSLCAVILYAVVHLVIQFGRFIEGDNTDADHFMVGLFFLIVIILLASVFIVGSFLLGEKILTVLGWMG